MRRGELRLGTFACPGCKALLDLPEFGSREVIVIAFVAIAASILVAYLLAGGAYAPAVGLLLAGPVTIAIAAICGFVWGTFFPSKVRRHVIRWPDEGTILHITSPPDPPKEP